MVSTMSRQLGEYLQEQQEPFILEVYLVERGCKKQRYLLESCSSTKSTRCMKTTTSAATRILGLKQGQKKFLPSCSKVVRSLFGRLLTITNSKKIILNSGIKNGRVGMSERDSRKQKKQQSTLSDSCTESEEAFYNWPRFADDYVLDENKVSAGWKFTWRDTTGNSKQLMSPVSVLLDEIESNDCSPNDIEFQRIEELMHSVSACKMEKRNAQEVDINIDGVFNTLFQFNRNKKAVHQAKHLLLDCLLEVVDSESPELVGTQQLQQLMSELWSKVALNESSVKHVNFFDALASDKTLKNWEEQGQEIGMVVGNMILEDIYNEFFAEMIGGFSS